MKKLFTLLTAILLGGASFAQPRFSSQGHKAKVVVAMMYVPLALYVKLDAWAFSKIERVTFLEAALQIFTL